MSEDYRSMWQNLGLDLVAHDALLGVLGKFYQDIYLAQKNRPEGMGYFDFVMSEVHGLRIKELLDEKAGRPQGHRLLLRVRAGGDRAGGKRHDGGPVRRGGFRHGRGGEDPAAQHLRADQVHLRLQAGQGLPLPRGLRHDRRREHLRRQEESLRVSGAAGFQSLRDGHPADEDPARAGRCSKPNTSASRRPSRS